MCVLAEHTSKHGNVNGCSYYGNRAGTHGYNEDEYPEELTGELHHTGRLVEEEQEGL